MSKFLKNPKRTSLLIGLLAVLAFAEALVVGKLYSDRNYRQYEVNLVKINTQKDSIDFLKMKNDLTLMDENTRRIHNFLTTKGVSDTAIAALAHDSLSSAVYLATQSNRYSQYLVDLEHKLQHVPLGMPTDGYISSNFGNRKNPIPFKPKGAPKVAEKNPAVKSEEVPTPQIIEEKDSAGNVVKRTVIPAKASAKSSAKNTNAPKEGGNPPAEADQIQFHKGIDIAVAYGSDVRCTAAGTVIWAGPKGGYGNCVIVSHSNGLATLYGHLSQVLVQVNDNVKVGQVIAKSGNTGRSTGPHLHYEVHKDGSPLNPKLFLNF